MAAAKGEILEGDGGGEREQGILREAEDWHGGDCPKAKDYGGADGDFGGLMLPVLFERDAVPALVVREARRRGEIDCCGCEGEDDADADSWHNEAPFSRRS